MGGGGDVTSGRVGPRGNDDWARVSLAPLHEMRGDISIDRNLTDQLHLAASQRANRRIAPALRHFQQIALLGPLERPADELYAGRAALAAQFDELAVFSLVEEPRYIRSPQLAGGVELVDRVGTEEEAQRSVAAETDGHPCGFVGQAKLGPLDEGRRLAEEILAVGFMERHP